MKHDPLRFLGLTKLQMIAVLVTLVVCVALVQGFLINQDLQLAKQGAESHAALCVSKAHVQAQIKETQDYLDSDTDGTIFGLPRALFQKSVHDQTAYVKTLAGLHC